MAEPALPFAGRSPTRTGPSGPKRGHGKHSGLDRLGQLRPGIGQSGEFVSI